MEGTSFYGFMESIGVTNIVDVAVAASDGYSKTVNYADLADAILAWEDETGAEISEEDGGPIRFTWLPLFQRTPGHRTWPRSG